MPLEEALDRLRALWSDRMRAQNNRSGAGHDQYGVKLGLDARLLGIVLMKPKQISTEDMDRMVRSNRLIQVSGWLNAYVVEQHPEKEALRQAWMASDRAMAARAGWSLTTERIEKSPDGLDLLALLDRI